MSREPQTVQTPSSSSAAAEPIRCPLCGVDEYTVGERCGEGYRVLICKGCDVGFVHPQPPPEFLERAYTDDYYQPWRQARRRRRRLWRRRWDRLRSCGCEAPLLDVGCGDGGFLEIAAEDMPEVGGTEFSPAGAAVVRAELGVPVQVGELYEIDLPRGSQRTITMWHTLEHMRDPLRNLRAAHRLLAPGGHLVVAVPNRDNRVFQWCYRMVRGRRPALFTPDDRELHLFHFTADSLRIALSLAGFRARRIEADRSQVTLDKRLVELGALAISALADEPWWNALMAVARQPAGGDS